MSAPETQANRLDAPPRARRFSEHTPCTSRPRGEHRCRTRSRGRTAPTIDVRALRARVVGDVVLPGDDGWDAARQAWNLAVDQRPAAVVLAETAEDVVAAVDFAREHGLRIAPQGTGHNASAARARGHRAPEDRAHAPRRRSTPTAGARASRPASSGPRSPRPRPSTASPGSPAPRRTSASSATRSAAASAGSPASTAWPRTACSRSSSSPPTAASSASTPTTSPSSSGRSAAAAAASAS